MTVKNRKKAPIRPADVVQKFPSCQLVALKKEGDLYLLTGEDLRFSDRIIHHEAWWVDYTGVERTFFDPSFPGEPFALGD